MQLPFIPICGSLHRRGHGRSTGGGEVARYIGRHSTKRVAKAVLISAVPPLMLELIRPRSGKLE
jgi:hypothetical protein